MNKGRDGCKLIVESTGSYDFVLPMVDRWKSSFDLRTGSQRRLNASYET